MGLFSRKKKPETKIPDFPSYESQIRSFETPTSFDKIPEPEFDEPEFDMPIRRKGFQPVGEEKPLFVKVEKYKTAVKHIDEIKSKLAEAEKVLRNLNNIKSEEEQEIKAWQEDIDEIKAKLMEVDKSLFEF